MTDPTPACPDQERVLHAFADGELDAVASAKLEEHLRHCMGCRTALQRIERTRALLADPTLREAMPDRLRERLLGALPAATPPARTRSLARPVPWLAGGAIGALAASVALLLVTPEITEPGLADALVDGQIRSLQSGHLVDVETSDRHTVKPWFNGRIAFAPPVVDLKAQGFPLVGGRLDVVAHENVAVLVFHRRLHTINLFIRPAPTISSPFFSGRRRAGYTIVRWVHGGLEFCAVSDLDPAELQQFRAAFESATRGG